MAKNMCAFRIGVDLIRRLDMCRKRKNTTVSDVIRSALENYLSNEKN